MTLSLVARCEETGRFGVAVCSSSPAVGARCAFTRAKVGAAASQNITDPTLGKYLLDLLGIGMSAPDALQRITNRRNFISYRQLLVVDKEGRSAVYSGSNALGIAGTFKAPNVAAAGNLLANEEVPAAIGKAFLDSEGDIGDRLITALKAGLEAGGESGPVHSAGMQICQMLNWPIVDLRCDWTEGCPVVELEKLWAIYEPQAHDYVTRAINPEMAPSFDVSENQ